MYLALTYDHRLLDGREAVTFLVKVFCLSSFGVRSSADSTTGQGVHRGPAPHAPWVNGSTVGTLLGDPCSCLEPPLGTLCRLFNFKIQLPSHRTQAPRIGCCISFLR